MQVFYFFVELRTWVCRNKMKQLNGDPVCHRTNQQLFINQKQTKKQNQNERPHLAWLHLWPCGYANIPGFALMSPKMSSAVMQHFVRTPVDTGELH